MALTKEQLRNLDTMFRTNPVITFIRTRYRNTINFFIFGWKFREYRHWDYGYIYQGLQVMLTITYQRFIKEQGGDYVGKEKDIKNMKICLDLLKYLVYDKDINAPFFIQKRLDKEHEEWDKVWAQALDSVQEEGMTRFTPPHAPIMRYWHKVELQNYQHKKDLLFKILRTQLTKWWI